ncbi:MAG: SoxR reducing system RseC family protein [bacterium]|jgi:positive regulator of sigma E activity
MRQIGVVVEDCGDKVKVKVCRATACNHCGQCPEEERQARSLLEPSKEIIVEAVNIAQAAVGQTVELTAPSSTVLMAAMWAYFVPLVAFITGAFLGHWFGPNMGLSSQGGSIVTGAVLLAGSYFLLRLKNKSFKQDQRFVPLVERVL